MKHQNRSQTSKKEGLTSSQTASLIAKGAENKKADDIEIIDVRKSSSICNYFVLCSANSSPHLSGIADGVDEILHKNGIKSPNWQGNPESGWIILDLISVVVHAMTEEERKSYKLEELWEKSGIVYHV